MCLTMSYWRKEQTRESQPSGVPYRSRRRDILSRIQRSNVTHVIRVGIQKGIEEFLGSSAARKLGIPPLPESANYDIVNTSYSAYDRTFGINGPEIMTRWLALHPHEKGAVVELAGYGIAAGDLHDDLVRKAGVPPEKLYSMALARQPFTEFDIAPAESFGGNISDFARDGGLTLARIHRALEANGVNNGAALIYLRPISAYLEIAERNGVQIRKPHPASPESDLFEPNAGYDKFFRDIMRTIATGLLAVDGTFAAELPPLLVNQEAFVADLRKELGTTYIVSDPRRGPWQLGGHAEGQGKVSFRFNNITIKRLK